MQLLPRFLFPKQLVTDFPIQNLPYGVFSLPKFSQPRIGVALGDKVIDLKVLAEKGLLPQELTKPTLNDFMAAGRPVWQEVRHTLQAKLLNDEHNASLKYRPDVLGECVHDRSSVKMHMPAHIGDYTDFYASKEHATNVGALFRSKENPLLPNWLHIPVGYHGRASSVVASGTPIQRPWGQIVPKGGVPDVPVFSPCKGLDIELEMAWFMGPGNAMGEPITVDRAKEHVFGAVLMNDWSARDIQKWEYVPLGPFLGKNFGTTISPWVVPLEALEPFAVDGPSQDPKPLDYLLHKDGKKATTFDVALEVSLETKTMREKQMGKEVICRSNLKHLYWNYEQMVAHHTCGGCNMRPGDLLGTGTISAPSQDGFGSLLEMTYAGAQPLTVKASGEQRVYLQDGDSITITGVCQKETPEGVLRIGFGECEGTITPARADPTK
eukprot:GDKI01032472.1.p1 GENE.GDKI01032472.1~~GDKI01032472.1.p1  ORF type:complete len:472 (-),score=150.47 GDKI01032472.1:23-1333(-)